MKRIFLLLLLAPLIGLAQSSDNFFQEKALNRAALGKGVLDRINGAERSANYKSIKYVQTPQPSQFKELVKSGKFTFGVPGTSGRFEYVANRIIAKSDTEFEWYGMADNGLDYAQVMSHKGKLFGQFFRGRDHYEFYTMEDGTQVLVEPKPMPEKGCSKPALSVSPKSTTGQGRQATCPDPLRVLVLYNAFVQSTTYDVTQLAFNAVGQFNQSIANIGLVDGVELAGVEYNYYDERYQGPSGQITYNDSRDFDRLRQTSNVLSLQTQYNADMVVQLVAGGGDSGYYSIYSNVAGQANTLKVYQAEYAIAFVVASLANSFVFAHELGHFLGGGHEAVDHPSQSYYARAKEFNGYKTIMYSGIGNIPYFSSPYAYYNGQPTGSNDRDNARQLREFTPIVRGLKGSPTTPYAAIDGNGYPTTAGNYTYEAVHQCYNVASFEWSESYDGWYYSIVGNGETINLFLNPGSEGNRYLKLTITYQGAPTTTAYLTINSGNCGSCRLATGQTTESELIVSPNPVRETATLKFSLSEKLDVSRFIANMQGKIVQKASYGELEPGTHEQTVDVRNLPAGSYLVNLRVGNKTVRQKLIVTH